MPDLGHVSNLMVAVLNVAFLGGMSPFVLKQIAKFIMFVVLSSAFACVVIVQFVRPKGPLLNCCPTLLCM